MHDSLGIQISNNGFVIEILQYTLMTGIILVIAGGTLIIIRKKL